MRDHFAKSQLRDGQWGYRPAANRRGTGVATKGRIAMTGAGLVSYVKLLFETDTQVIVSGLSVAWDQVSALGPIDHNGRKNVVWASASSKIQGFPTQQWHSLGGHGRPSLLYRAGTPHFPGGLSA